MTVVLLLRSVLPDDMQACHLVLAVDAACMHGEQVLGLGLHWCCSKTLENAAWLHQSMRLQGPTS